MSAWSEGVKQQLRYEISNWAMHLFESKDATLDHCLMCIRGVISDDNKLVLSFPRGKEQFGTGIMVIGELFEEAIQHRTDAPIDSLQFDIAMMEAALHA